MGFGPLDTQTVQGTWGLVVGFSINLFSVAVSSTLASKCTSVLFMTDCSRSSVFLSLRWSSPSDKKSNELQRRRGAICFQVSNQTTVHADSETLELSPVMCKNHIMTVAAAGPCMYTCIFPAAYIDTFLVL